MGKFFVVSLLVVCALGTANADKSLTLDPPKINAEVGATFSVPIYIDTTVELNVVSFNVQFPADILQGLPPNNGSCFPLSLLLENDRYACGATGNGFSGQGLLETLNFVGLKAGVANISLINIQMAKGNSEVFGYTANDCQVTVGQVPEASSLSGLIVGSLAIAGRYRLRKR